jgi:hypothetical protein
VTIHSLSGSEDAFLSTASEALVRVSGADALDVLGWWDLLTMLDEAEPRQATFALFRAQGRQLASSPALGALMAQPYVAGRCVEAGSIAATITRRSTRRETVTLLVGDVPSECLLVDRPGSGTAVIDVEDVTLRPIHLPGRLEVHEVEADLTVTDPAIPEAVAEPARRRSRFLGRIATASEMLGAAEAVLALAVDHARNREQFGNPIGSFQAVRHLLAWAGTDCVALAAAVDHAVALDRAAPLWFDQVVKALAGRNGRRVCERTLQVLGAVGFTAEHDHHHFHSRVLALDSLLGSYAALARDLGSALRAQQADPEIPARFLLPSDT